MDEDKKTKKSEYFKKWSEEHKDKMYEAHRKDYKKHRKARLQWQHEYYLNKKKAKKEK
jgi:hypothetical protein